jgi:hypothetical protein
MEDDHDNTKNVEYRMQRRFNNMQLNVNPIKRDNVHVHINGEPSITSQMRPKKMPDRSVAKKMQYALTSHGNR